MFTKFEELKDYKIQLILLIAVILFLWSTCNDNPSNTQIVRSDTLTTVIKKTDTVFLKPDTIEVVKLVPKHIKDTIYIKENGDSINLSVYKTHYDDSLINAVITSNVDGLLINTGIKYTPKFPKYIVDSIFTNTTITNEIDKTPRYTLFFGGGPQLGLSYIGLDLNLTMYQKKTETLYTVGYDPFNQNIEVKFQKTLFKIR